MRPRHAFGRPARRGKTAPALKLCLSAVRVVPTGSRVGRGGGSPIPVPPAGLSEREIAATRLVATGMSDAQIAAELGVARSTAHEFVEKAKRRLKVRNRAELIAVALQKIINSFAKLPGCRCVTNKIYLEILHVVYLSLLHNC